MKKLKQTFYCLFILAITGCGNKNTTNSTKTSETEKPAEEIAVNPLKNCYFGDLHLHTSLSTDAFLFGAKSMPENSYQYAMGEEVDYVGGKIKRIAPLDFLAVTDHAEYLGLTYSISDPNGPFAKTSYYKQFSSTNPDSIAKNYHIISQQVFANKPNPDFINPEMIKSFWQKEIDAANKYNKPGKFTALVGYEWTSAPGRPEGTGAQNLHRCIIFKGDKVGNFTQTDPYISL